MVSKINTTTQVLTVNIFKHKLKGNANLSMVLYFSQSVTQQEAGSGISGRWTLLLWSKYEKNYSLHVHISSFQQDIFLSDFSSILNF